MPSYLEPRLLWHRAAGGRGARESGRALLAALRTQQGTRVFRWIHPFSTTVKNVSTRNNALALSVIGGLLLVISATTAFALTPSKDRPIPQGGLGVLSSPTLHFRNVKAIQMANHELGDERWTSGDKEIPDDFERTEAQAIDLGSRYDGKTIPT
jgi:hypothetical protein